MRLERGHRRVDLFLVRLPERMILRQSQTRKRLHRPIRRAGRVVALRHQQAWIAIADGQHAVAGENRFREPLAHIAEQQMLHLPIAYGVAFAFRQCQCRVERALRKAIGQTAPIRQCFAAPVKPAGEIRRHLFAALDVFAAALRVAPAHDLGINQTIEMERPHGVILALIEVIKVPAVALVMLFNHGEILLHAFRVIRHAADHEAHIDQHAEECPVVLGHVVMVDLVKPCVQLLLRFFRQVEEKLLRAQAPCPYRIQPSRPDADRNRRPHPSIRGFPDRRPR